jgi:23S rRNA G2445 N2-methylase RlmL
MKFYALTDSGMEEPAKKELLELVNIKPKISEKVFSFDLEEKDLQKLVIHSQSFTRILTAIGSYKDLDKLDIDFNWKNFSNAKTFKIEVENVKGQENRLDIARKIIPQLVEDMKKKDFIPTVDVKNPELLIVVYHTGKEYFFGVDLCGEMNDRAYRVFPHQASFKGDLGYFFVHESSYKPGDKLLVGFCKDAVIAIEAAFHANKIPVRKCNIPFLEKSEQTTTEKEQIITHAFDESIQNITAARKNAKLAKVPCDIQKYHIEDLDVKYSENEFDKVILQITRKDEDKINEIYYQLSYILKKGGKLLLIGRESWELSVSDKFKLIKKSQIQRGDSIHLCWLLEKI